jgi:hypothetical protein
MPKRQAMIVVMGGLLLSCIQSPSVAIQGSAGPTKYVEFFHDRLQGARVGTMGWVNGVPFPYTGGGEPDCNDPLHAHCHRICVKIDKKRFDVSQPLDVVYGGKFKNDPNECMHGGGYHHCPYNVPCADGPAIFKDQQQNDSGDTIEACATLKNWNHQYGRCGWMTVGIRNKK